MPGFKQIGLDAPVVVVHSDTAAAGAQVDTYVFVSDGYYEVLEVRENHRVVGGSGAEVDVNKCASGTVIGSGTSVLATAFNLETAEAATPQRRAISLGTMAAVPTRTLIPGDSLALDYGGTLTGLLGVGVTIVLKRTRHDPRQR